jgi:hypothetical protein
MQFNGTRYEPIGGVLGSPNWFEFNRLNLNETDLSKGAT